jgi:hypothetical protein
MPRAHVQVGDQFGNLTVIDLAGSDERGNQLVRVRCSCLNRTEKTVRLSGLTFKPYYDGSGKERKPYRSCGCESKRAHRDFWELRARRLKARIRRSIWAACQQGKTLDELTNRYELPAGVILAACRLYNRKHPARLIPAIPYGSKAASEWSKAHSPEHAIHDGTDSIPVLDAPELNEA